MAADLTSAGETATDTVFRLIYRSHSRIADDDRSAELASIFTTARRNNRGQQITGALMVSDGAFVQALEGDEAQVRSLFETIRGDRRHTDVTLLNESEAPRIFGRWAMAKVSHDEGPDIRLASHAGRDQIVAIGKDPSITAAQEQVLSFMRGALGDGA
jgi:hypothetical protein